jgi:hypothetical protein
MRSPLATQQRLKPLTRRGFTAATSNPNHLTVHTLAPSFTKLPKAIQCICDL